MYKPTLTITGCVTTVIYLYIFSCSTVQGQSVTLDQTSVGSVSTCSSGLRDGLDFYIFRGIVDATTAMFSNFIDFSIMTESSNSFQYLCTVSLFSCLTPNPQPCYCAVRKGDVYEIVANKTATLAYSRAMIRIQWHSSSGVRIVSNQLQLPTIYDVNAVTTSVTINDAYMSCPTTVTFGSVFKFQCLNAPSPCEVTISLNGKVVVKSEHIATYIVPTNLTLNSRHSFTFSYSVCGGHVKSTTCQITIVTIIG
ncbi:unnamed protein product [Lymnaea stagnalis]|uniref:ZP domain-containing protein n=1 Tax=Lymnaea stagnalis TaxID=6523 RepID=A0AAV2HDE9_LYMST